MKQPIKKRVARANGISTEKQVYTLIVDGNNLLKISLVDKRMSGDGKEYGAVMTFLRKLGDVLKKKDFDYCIVSWDGLGSGVMRWKLYPDYKANRDKHYELFDDRTDYDRYISVYVSRTLKHRKQSNTVRGETEEESFNRQKGILQGILEELCIRQYEFDNVEGDDIVSYYVKHKNPGEKVVIMSSDRDMTQLISDTVIIWNPRDGGSFITADDSVQKLGITHENIVLEKILCGDDSDNIKGVKGLGEQTLVKYFPEVIGSKTDLDAIIRRSREILDERRAARKKPLKVLENIINGVTDGCQGDRLYEVNRKIIDLSEPLVTDEAEEYLRESLYAPMDTTDRNLKNVYRIIEENKMYDLTDEKRFGDILAPYSRICMMERRRYDEFEREAKKH